MIYKESRFFCTSTRWIKRPFIQQRCINYFSIASSCRLVGHGLAIVLLSGTLLTGCRRDTEEIVQAKVAERVQAFRIKHLGECQTALLRDAEKRVDSMLLAEATGTLADSLARLKPFKPTQPPAVAPIDSLSVRPIFELPSGN